MDVYRAQNVSGNWSSDRDIKPSQSWSSVIHRNPVPLMKEAIISILKARCAKVRVLELVKRANWSTDPFTSALDPALASGYGRVAAGPDPVAAISTPAGTL